MSATDRYCAYEWAGRVADHAAATVSGPAVHFDFRAKVYTLRRTNGTYDTGTANTIRFAPWAPEAVAGWYAFAAAVVLPKDANGNSPTAIDFRVSDGSDDYYWNGSAWAVASGPSHWNAAADVCAHLEDFDASARSLAPVARLTTTDPNLTPILRSVTVVGRLLVNSERDEWVHRALLAQLREHIRYPVDFRLRWKTGTTQDLAPLFVGVETPGGKDAAAGRRVGARYDVVDVLEAYDVTNDPDRLENLRAGFAVAGETAVLTSSRAIAAGAEVVVVALVRPAVALQSSLDYSKAIYAPFLSVRYSQEYTQRVGSSLMVFPTGPGTAKTLRVPDVVDYKIPIDVQTVSGVQCFALAEAVDRWIRTQRELRSARLDTSVWFGVDSLVGYYPRPDEDGLYRATMIASLGLVPSLLYSPADGNIVGSVSVTADHA